MTNGQEVNMVSSELAQAVYNYIKDFYEFASGVTYTTRELYTVYDLEYVKHESRLKKEYNDK